MARSSERVYSMKEKIFPAMSCLILAILLLSCNSGKIEERDISADVITNPNTASGKSDLSKLPVLQFEEETHDFGKIIEGETVSYEFKFRNTGKADLIIADVSTSCGCTVPSYSKSAVQPGKSGVIKVTFNSAGRRGFQTKNIVIAANTQPNTTLIRIKAQVVNPGSEK